MSELGNIFIIVLLANFLYDFMKSVFSAVKDCIKNLKEEDEDGKD